MPRPRDHEEARTPIFVSGLPRTRYLVVRQQDLWFIKFEGEEYGPYVTEREALLFAIDAAQKLGEQGETTGVFLVEENGAARPVWTHGRDQYPPRL